MNTTIDYKCLKCLIEKNLNMDKIQLSDAQKTLYLKDFLKLLADAPDTLSAPELVEQITNLQTKYQITAFDYTEIKKYYNHLLLHLEEEIYNKIIHAEKPLLTACKYALIGNYIDFGTNLNINEDMLHSLIDSVDSISFDTTEFFNFERELKTCKELVYLTDNCGEIVFDKILIKYLKEHYKDMNITAIVRGKNILNDATQEDATQVHLNDFAKVYDNGTGIAGTVLSRINSQSLSLIDHADMIISKGMGNFETLQGCNKNIYYLFMCKCEKICSIFQSPLFTYMFLNEKRLER